MCSPLIEKLGASPANIQWTVVRGDNANLKNASELIELADKLAYESKTSGRDRITSSRGQIV